MNNTITDKKQDDAVVETQDIASVYLDNARATIDFLVDIPSVLSKYIFFCITAEAYDMATFSSMGEIKDQFITAVAENCYKRKAAYIKEVWMNLTTTSRLKEKINNCNSYQELIKNEAWQELPSLQSLNGCFEYFDVSDRSLVEWDLKSYPLGQRFISTLTKDGLEIYLSGDVFLETGNCFQKLGYKTQYINILNNDSDKYDKLFFRWYCMGEVLDIILETIFSNRNVQLSKSLYYHLTGACKDNDTLSKLIQARYDQIMSYRPGFKNITFYDGLSKPVVVDNELVEEIKMESLPYGIGGLKDYTDDDYKKLYGKLLTLRFIKPKGIGEKYGTSLEDFLSVFSDGKIKDKIYWYGPAKELSYFIQVLEKIKIKYYISQRDFFNQAAVCFKRIDKGILKKTNKENIKQNIAKHCIDINKQTVNLYELNIKALLYKEEEQKKLKPYILDFMKNNHMPLEPKQVKRLIDENKLQ